MISGVFIKWREAAIGITLAASLIFAYDSLINLYRNNIPVMAFFEVYEVFVPDHIVGSNPTLIYNRDIKQPFYGRFTIEVQELTYNSSNHFTLKTVCTATGAHTYTPTTFVGPREVTWNWFMEDQCDIIQPGTYRLNTTWSVIPEEFSPKTAVNVSNAFTVFKYDKEL